MRKQQYGMKNAMHKVLLDQVLCSKNLETAETYCLNSRVPKAKLCKG